MTPKIPNKTIVTIRGWVMLAGLPPGRYRVEHYYEGVVYRFYKPKGRILIVSHYVTDVDPWVKPVNCEDQNQITMDPLPWKTTFTAIQDIPGIYLVLPGSNSVWAGFLTKRHAARYAKSLPQDGWSVCVRK